MVPDPAAVPLQMERLWGSAGEEEEGGGAHPALLTTGADGVLRVWVEVGFRAQGLRVMCCESQASQVLKTCRPGLHEPCSCPADVAWRSTAGAQCLHVH